MLFHHLPLFLSSFFVLAGAQQDGLFPIVQFHGSGTSNPDRCYWHILETMNAQTKLPTWTTYRSTSSGPGQIEFMGNVTHPFTHFASSDYPLPKEQYDIIKNAGKEMIHLPILMGAIGIFHSVPVPKMEDQHVALDMNLTSCLVARIYKGDIDDWNHPDILAINPHLNLPVQLNNYGKPKEDQSFSIKVAHRVLGSSSTFAFTSYLHKSCPDHWGEELVGSSIEWPMAGKENLLPAQGTSAMLSTIQSEPGTIGFADAGLALDQGVSEVALHMEQVSMKNGFFLTSKNALNKDGVSATLQADGAGIPSRGDADWSGVDLINQVEGYIYAWPMVLMTYVLVRKDLPSFILDPRAQSLLVAFLKNLYDPIYMEKCEQEFLFLPVKGEMRDVALESIAMLELSPGAPEWIQETSVMAEGGQSDYVISARRKRASAIQQDILSEKVSRAETALDDVLEGMDSILSRSNEMQLELEQVAMAQASTDDSLLDEKEQRIDASFAMAIVSLILWFLSALVLCSQQAKLRSLDARQNQAPEQPKKKHHHHRPHDSSA